MTLSKIQFKAGNVIGLYFTGGGGLLEKIEYATKKKYFSSGFSVLSPEA